MIKLFFLVLIFSACKPLELKKEATETKQKEADNESKLENDLMIKLDQDGSKNTEVKIGDVLRIVVTENQSTGLLSKQILSGDALGFIERTYDSEHLNMTIAQQIGYRYVANKVGDASIKIQVFQSGNLKKEYSLKILVTK